MIALRCAALCRATLHYTELFCSCVALHCAEALRCVVLRCAALCGVVLRCAALH
jgi:hypothetical protein